MITSRVDINRDFLNKNQKNPIFLFKSDFFDLNQILRFKLIFLTNVSHLLGNSNINKSLVFCSL